MIEYKGYDYWIQSEGLRGFLVVKSIVSPVVIVLTVKVFGNGHLFLFLI